MRKIFCGGKIVKQKTLLFDFDGVLVDSMPYWGRKMLNILDTYHVDYPPDILKTLATKGDLGSARYFQEEFGVPLSIEEMLAMMDTYALPRYRDEIPAKEGVADYLRSRRAAGDSLNVLTASPHKMLDPCLKRLGLYDLFDHVWSTDDFGLPKTDPEIYRLAARQLGEAEKDVVFFDDNINAIRTAAEAGMFTVGVFDESGEEYTEEMRAAADRYIRSFTELDEE